MESRVGCTWGINGLPDNHKDRILICFKWGDIYIKYQVNIEKDTK